MPRTLAIDYGEKRTGLAWTDPLGLIATPLPAVYTTGLKAELQRLIAQEVTVIVLGYPTRLDGRPTHATPLVEALAQELLTTYPQVLLHLADERLTSRLAQQAMAMSGATRKQKQDKMLENSISATILLQEYLR